MPTINERKEISVRDLNTWMTRELMVTGLRNGSQILVKARLSTPDSTGCNWSKDVYVSQGFNTLTEYNGAVLPAAKQIVEKAHSLFNLTPN